MKNRLPKIFKSPFDYIFQFPGARKRSTWPCLFTSKIQAVIPWWKTLQKPNAATGSVSATGREIQRSVLKGNCHSLR